MAQFGPIRWKSFRHWLKEPLGQAFLESEANEVDGLIHKLFGYHLLLIGDVHFAAALRASPIQHRVWIHPHTVASQEISPLISRQDKLPIMSGEIDLVYLAHCLEFLRNPHETLREAYRVIRPEGHVLITCFNPWSLWGIYRRLVHFIKRAPWDGRFISLYRLRDWLALLGFDVIEVRGCFFRPPLSKTTWLQNFIKLEKSGRWCWPHWGACNIILAQKRVMTLTPLRPRFKTKRRPLPTPLVEPAARVKDF